MAHTLETSDHRITPVDREQHTGSVARLVSDEFAGGEHVDEIARKYYLECHFDWDASRLIWDAGQLVHHWGVWGYDMRVDGSLLRTAGVGAVVTRGSHRKQGLMQQAAQDSFRAMRAGGYQLSILRGRHYARFGYVRAWNYVTYRLQADQLRPAVPAPAYRLQGPETMSQINALYNRTHDRFSGSAVRPTYSMLSPDDMQCYGWGAGQNLDGYVRAVPGEQGELQCLEACGDPEQSLAVLADLMAQGGFDGLSFFTLHHDHPLLRRVRRGAVQVEQRFFERSGWQIKLINLPSALTALRPAFEARLERSQFVGWQGGLLLDAGGERALLAIDRGRVAVSEADAAEHAITAGPAIGRLLIGSDDPAEVLDQARAETSGLGAALAQALFPNLHPVLAHWDEF